MSAPGNPANRGTVGAIASAWCNEQFGRKYTLFAFDLVFMVGAAMQTGTSSEIGLIYAGRVIAGLGIGGMSSVMSVYVAENSPPRIRGRISGGEYQRGKSQESPDARHTNFGR